MKLLLSKSDIDVNCFAHFINEDPDYFRDETIEYNKTPLYIAVSVECPEIIELLLSNNKTDPNILSLEKFIYIDYGKEEEEERKRIAIITINFTALHLAVDLQKLTIIEILLKNKSININVENNEGVKPFDFVDDEKIKELFNKYRTK